jgi:hypothetical protein
MKQILLTRSFEKKMENKERKWVPTIFLLRVKVWGGVSDGGSKITVIIINTTPLGPCLLLPSHLKTPQILSRGGGASKLQIAKHKQQQQRVVSYKLWRLFRIKTSLPEAGIQFFLGTTTTMELLPSINHKLFQISLSLSLWLV